MKTLEAYYRESVRFLRVAGKEYASAHPDTGRYLNRDNLELVWPDFEDILRGLGFLGARIHALLDKTQNDFYGDLVKLLWPQLVDEVPSVCLMKITPKSYILNGTRMISRGTTVASKKIVRSRVQCLFTTTQTVKVSPISLTALDTSSITPATSALTFRFSLKPGLSWNDLDLDPLRVHLVGESAITIALHELITRHCTGARITMGNSPVDEFVVNGRDAITPGGIGPDETLLPPDPRSNWAMSILTEYFIFREKFLCFDLHGINGNGLHKDRKTPSTISVTLSFDCGLPKNKPFGVENFTLFCTPAVNLFRSNLEPVAAKLTYDEYALTADHSHRASIQPHSVISVTGTNRTTGARVAYAPFANFAAAHTCAPTWRTRRQTRGRASAIVLLLGGREPVTAPPDGENISIDAWCTNGDAPRNELHEGDIAYCKAGLPDGISVTNITSPTASVLPREDDSLDVITALLGGNYRELSDARTMRAFFKAHDRSGSEGNGRRTGSIRHVSMTQTTALHCGAVLRGVCYKVELDEAAFSDLNDLHLFGQSAAAFLSLWSRMETFTELVIVCKPSGRELRWSSLETWLQKLDGACGGSVAGEDPICAPEAVFPVLPPVSAMAQHVEGHPGETDSLAKLMKKIEHEVSALNFFGTMRLFEGYYASLDIRDPFASGNILLVPDDSFLFPTSDIVAVERHENRYIIKLAFMGLTGASSPLPVHWSQVIVEKPEKAAAFLALLTVFNRRFFELFYEANKKYRLDPLPGSYSRDHLVMLIAALGGMSPNARQELAIRETNALSSLPLYAVAPRSATGLARVIATCFAIPKARVHVDRFLGYRENIPVGQQTMLGTANSFLGRNTLLGEAIVSAGSRIRLTIGPVTLQQYEHMVTQDSRECAILKEMIEGYIPSTFDYEIKLLVLAHDMLPAVLGDGKARLGFNMAFGKPANPLAVTTAAIPGRSPDDRRLSPETMLAIEESGLFDRSFGNYFEHELRALYDSAHAFAKGFSGAGNELSITSTGSGDPTVERMFQGAAFHTARVRETLDDTLSGLSERLFQREWRGFSDPLPSATIVAFSPRKGSLTGTTVLPRGTELLSKALSKSGDRAVFSTTQTVALNPISLETVVKSVDARGRGSIEFGFNVDGGISWPAVNLDPLRLYFHGDAPVTFALHRMFMHEVDNVAIRYDGGGPGYEATIDGPLSVRFPFCETGYRLLQGLTDGFSPLIEYNVFMRKFLFVDLFGFHDGQFLKTAVAPRTFSVTVRFKTNFDRKLTFGIDSFRLFCSPAVNICKRNAILQTNGVTDGDFIIVAPKNDPATLVPHSVAGVTGLVKVGETSREYMKKSDPMAFGRDGAETWESYARQGYDGRSQVRLELCSGSSSGAWRPPADLTVSAYFTNGSIPHTALSVGDVAFHTAGFPDRIDFVNITKPTLPALPPRGDAQWRFLALVGAQPFVPTGAYRLKQLLRLFDWSGEPEKNAVFNAITEFNSRVVARVENGVLERGIEYRLSLDMADSNEADGEPVHLFGRCLSEFLRSKTIPSSFITLTIVMRPSETILHWDRMTGTRLGGG